MGLISITFRTNLKTIMENLKTVGFHPEEVQNVVNVTT